ncbi:hypothetical protein THAOC_07166, partial [Thalassiosira oceanica]
GDCSVPQKQGSLGAWVSNQRAARRGDKMSDERVRKLDDIGFDWGTARPKPPSSDDPLDELAEHMARHGDCGVSQSQGSIYEYE